MDNKSIPELIAFLKHALGDSHFKEVEAILVEREENSKLEIVKLRMENETLKKKCEALSLDCNNGGGEGEESAEEIYDQLVRELVGGKGEKESDDEVGRLKKENEELKRKNGMLRKLILDCVENYVDWNNRLWSSQRDVARLKTMEVVGFGGVSKSGSGGNGKSRESSVQNHDNGMPSGNVHRVLDFDGGMNDHAGVAPVKVEETEILVDQDLRVAPVKSTTEVIDIDNDLQRTTYEGNMASQKPIDGEHSNQSYASKGQKRKGYSYINGVDLDKDSSSINRFDGFDFQKNRENVKDDEKSTQNVRSAPKVFSSAISTPGGSDANRVASKSQDNVPTLRQCDERNAKQRRLLERLKMPSSGIAQTYDYEDCRDGDVSANRLKTGRQWNFLADMDAAFSIDKICMSAVCTLCRQHERARKRTEGSTCRGFNSYCFERGMQLAEFLIDGDSKSRLRKTGKELQSRFKKGLEDCRYIAKEHATQLFEIYQKKLDAFYPDA